MRPNPPPARKWRTRRRSPTRTPTAYTTRISQADDAGGSGLFATRVRRRGLVAALACGTLVTAAMAMMALATALYIVALAVGASNLAGQDNGPFGVPSVGISIGIQLVIMPGAASLAAVSTRRGWLALGRTAR